MQLIEWRDEFSTGFEEVDHEHRELIRLINQVHANLVGDRADPLIGAFLGEVHAKIAAHFALEEKVMQDERYAAYPEHKGEHEGLLGEIREIMDAYDAGGYVGAEEDLGDRLTVWFGRHFQTHDARFGRAVAGKPRAGTAPGA